MKLMPLDVTLDADGNGSVVFRAHKAAVAFRVVKITVEMDVTSSGKTLLYKNGSFLTAMPVAPTMEAYGSTLLYCSEYMTAEIQSGPGSTQVRFTFYYEEISVNP